MAKSQGFFSIIFSDLYRKLMVRNELRQIFGGPAGPQVLAYQAVRISLRICPKGYRLERPTK